jgi:hypothetical protein
MLNPVLATACTCRLARLFASFSYVCHSNRHTEIDGTGNHATAGPTDGSGHASTDCGNLPGCCFHIRRGTLSMTGTRASDELTRRWTQEPPHRFRNRTLPPLANAKRSGNSIMALSLKSTFLCQKVHQGCVRRRGNRSVIGRRLRLERRRQPKVLTGFLLSLSPFAALFRFSVNEPPLCVQSVLLSSDSPWPAYFAFVL